MVWVHVFVVRTVGCVTVRVDDFLGGVSIGQMTRIHKNVNRTVGQTVTGKGSLSDGTVYPVPGLLVMSLPTWRDFRNCKSDGHRPGIWSIYGEGIGFGTVKVVSEEVGSGDFINVCIVCL